MIGALRRAAAGLVLCLAGIGLAGCGDDGSDEESDSGGSRPSSQDSGESSADATEAADPVAALCPQASAELADAAEVVGCAYDLNREFWAEHGLEIIVPVVVEPSPDSYAAGSGCETALPLGSAFYCVGINVAFTQAQIERQYAGLDADGPLGMSFLVAQQAGYVILDLAGDQVFAKDSWSVEDYTAMEQASDCLAGVWAASLDAAGQLDLADFRAVSEQALTIEAGYQPPPGPRSAEPITYNPVPQRLAAFDAGTSGDPAACGVAVPA